jgi:hypothetical protein
MSMKRVKYAFAAAMLGLVIAALPPFSPAYAETEVLESDVAELPIGTKIADETRVKIPDGSKLRVLVVTSGTTKTLKGPYEGTIEDYKEDRSWWERITGRSKDSDAPIGATRGFKPE